MKRAVVAVVVSLLLLVGHAGPAGAGTTYTHFGATNNVGLSVQWSQALFPGSGSAPTAILVRSDSFADSLAAGALAGFVRAPIFLHPSTGGLDPRIEGELSRLGTDLVRVIGGTSAISAQTVDDLVAAGYDVHRLAGANRIDTAVQVMQQTSDSDGNSLYEGSSFVYLARAFGTGSTAFADSIGAGMIAGTQGIPLLLSATEALSAETRTALSAAPEVETVFIVGGTAAISGAVETELRGMGLEVERVAGPDRFETAARIADESFDPALPGIIALVDGLNANSWASGYPAAAMAGGAVVLSNGDSLPDPTASFLTSQNGSGAHLYCAPEVGHDACLLADELLNGPPATTIGG